MADIAIAFHWPPEAMHDMDLAELMDWREAARLRLGNDDNRKR